MENHKCDWHDSIKAVVAIPAIRLSTSEARRVMPKNVPISDAVSNICLLYTSDAADDP